MENMIIWADKVHRASLNQAIVPRALLVLNAIHITGHDRDSWLDGARATQRTAELMKSWAILSTGLTKIADKWNAMLPENEKVASMMDLFLRYFKSLSVVCLPRRDDAHEAGDFFRQAQCLYAKIKDLSNDVGIERRQNLSEINSERLESVLNSGIQHFVTKFGEPFDFFRHAMAHLPMRQHLADYATALMMEVRETEDNHQELDTRCAKLFASYRSLLILKGKISPGKLLFNFLILGLAETDRHD